MSSRVSLRFEDEPVSYSSDVLLLFLQLESLSQFFNEPLGELLRVTSESYPDSSALKDVEDDDPIPDDEDDV